MQKKNMLTVVAMVLIAVVLSAVTGFAQYRTWTYQPADLSGSSCIQVAIDALWDISRSNYVQKGSISVGSATATNTFELTYIETPKVIWRYTTAGIPATNAITVTSNGFTIAAIQTNGEYIAVGKVK